MRKFFQNLFSLAFVLLITAIFQIHGYSVDKDLGIIVVAHGARKGEWNQLVKDTVAKVKVNHPMEVAFLMHAEEGERLQDCVDRLEARGVKKIIVVPYFVSSYSGHFDELKYYLGKSDKAPAHVHNPPVKHKAELILTSAIDDDPLAAEILYEYACEISREPEKETVIIVAHGPNEDDYNKVWLEKISNLGKIVKEKGKFKAVWGATLRDDAPSPVRDEATRALRGKVIEASKNGTALIVPLLISKGPIQEGIRDRLHGLDFIMNDKGLSPHPNMTKWITKQILNHR